MQKSIRSFNGLEDSQKEYIKYFLFNGKVFSIDVNRYVIAPPNIQFHKVNEEGVAKMVLSLVTTFTIALGEAILFPPNHKIGYPYAPKTKD